MVTLECVEKLIRKDMVDPVNGDKLTERDIIVLQRVSLPYPYPLPFFPSPSPSQTLPAPPLCPHHAHPRLHPFCPQPRSPLCPWPTPGSTPLSSPRP